MTQIVDDKVAVTQEDRDRAASLIEGADLTTLNRYEQYVAQAFAQARLAGERAERERCAAIARSYTEDCDEESLSGYVRGGHFTAKAIEAAIRKEAASIGELR